MKKHQYEVAKEAFAILQFYSDHYASGKPFADQFDSVISLLREKALTYNENTSADRRATVFLQAFADALIFENSGEHYKSPFE